MTLQPTSQTQPPTYPERKASLFRRGGRWIRRVGATVAVAAAFGMSGCFLVQVDGVMMEPEYFCEEEGPVEVEVPGTFTDVLCENTTRWGVFQVDEQTSMRFAFDAEGLLDPAAIAADVIDPDGTVVGTVLAGEPLELTLTPGEWQVGVSSSYFDEGDFALNIDLVHER